MPTPDKPSSNDSTPPNSPRKSSPDNERPSSPSSSDASEPSTESQGPLSEREPLPDWLFQQSGRTGGTLDLSQVAPDPTGSAASSGTSPEPSPESTSVWKPWNGELTVPPELIPEFIRTQTDLAIQIVQDEISQMQQLLDATPREEWLLRHTLTKQRVTLELTRLELLGILFRNQEETSPSLFVPDPTLIGANGRPL